jgi:hypothetical protein
MLNFKKEKADHWDKYLRKAKCPQRRCTALAGSAECWLREFLKKCFTTPFNRMLNVLATAKADTK